MSSRSTLTQRLLAALAGALGQAPSAKTSPDGSVDPDADRVIVAATTWTVNGVNVFSSNLVRGLNAAGIPAEILITEEDTALVENREARLPRPKDVRFRSLPVASTRRWGSRWGAMRRYLEESAPCVYIPNHDWRHSAICPFLPEDVMVVGIVHSDDPLHYDHVRRLGRYWNVIVAVSQAIAERTAREFPELAERIVRIPIGVSIPDAYAPRPASEPVLRVIYHGILKQHQKRVLDLPAIVQRALDDGVRLVLSIAGSGPDEDLLRERCAALVERGAIRFLGVQSPEDIARLLSEHDAYLLCSEFEGMPNALIEAMGRGCVPVVSRMRSGIPELLREGENGLLAQAGDIAAFAMQLRRLQVDPQLRASLAAAAYDTASHGGFRVGDMVSAYQRAFAEARQRVRTGAFVRPRGTLSPPPAEVAGVSLFPLALEHDEPGVGSFPTPEDAEDYLLEVARIRKGGTRQRGQQDPAALRGMRVFVSAPDWSPGGVNAWCEDLARGLRRAGMDARILLTEEDTALVSPPAVRLARPTDLPFETLRTRGPESWGARWGALVRTLEAAAPCIYLPVCDWRHAGIAPVLSPQVKVVASAFATDALAMEQLNRLCAAWDAVVATSYPISRQIRTALPILASRLSVIQHGPAVPAVPVERPQHSHAETLALVLCGDGNGDEWDRLSACIRTASEQLRWRFVLVDPPLRCQTAWSGNRVESRTHCNRQEWLQLCREASVVWVGGNAGVRRQYLEAIGYGCVPVWSGVGQASDFWIDDAVNGVILAEDAPPSEYGRLRDLMDDANAVAGLRKRAHALAAMQSLPANLMIESFMELFEQLFHFPHDCPRRPGSPILPAPAEVDGKSVLPIDLSLQTPSGVFTDDEDWLRFLRESRP